MTEIQRGFRSKLDSYFDISKEIIVSVVVQGSSTYDSCCFGVDADDRLSDDSYMIFYNQTSSPNREIVLSGGGSNTTYAVNISKLPSRIHKLVFTVSIDGAGVMKQINSLTVIISQSSNSIKLNLGSTSFSDEKAVIAIELYKKDVWRMAAVASGFNGGLSALLKHYGGEEDLSEPQVQTQSNKVSLEKQLEKDAPQLVSLAKPLKISLEKHKLTDCVAQVALLIDISGSMRGQFQNGTVQEVINKIVPLAMQFDDNGEFELWYFGSDAKRNPSVTIYNYSQATDNWMALMSRYGGGTNLVPAISDVISEYKNSRLPAYVLCITDGATSNAAKVKKLVIESSRYPIFWQFIGIGGYNYGILESLDTMGGRVVDNANFFSLDDIARVDNTELYSRMLAEFPVWLREAKRLSILK